MASTDLDVRKREISALVDGVIELEQALLAKGIDARDYEDRAEALDIIRRIERRLMAKAPATVVA